MIDTLSTLFKCEVSALRAPGYAAHRDGKLVSFINVYKVNENEGTYDNFMWNLDDAHSLIAKARMIGLAVTLVVEYRDKYAYWKVDHTNDKLSVVVKDNRVLMAVPRYLFKTMDRTNSEDNEHDSSATDSE